MPKKQLKKKIQNKPYAKWRLIGALLILSLLVLRFNLYHDVTNSNHQVSLNSFNSSINSGDSLLKQRFEIYTDTLYSGRALLMSDSSVTRTVWSNFVAYQNVLQRYPGVNAIAYLKVVNRSQVPSLVAQLNSGQPNGTNVAIFPASQDSQLAVLTYVAPNSTDQKFIGYDVYTDPVRTKALDTARDTGLPQVSKPLTLKSDASGSAPGSILIAMPTYSPNGSVFTVADRQSSLTGYVILALHIKPLLDSVFIQPYDNNISVSISTGGKVIYSHGKTWTDDVLKRTILLNIGGQTWRLNYSAPSTLGLGTTSRLAPTLMILSVVPLLAFYLLAFYFSLRYYTLRRHHREHHSGDSDHDPFDIF